MRLRTGSPAPFELAAEQRRGLHERLRVALERARSTGRPTLATLSVALDVRCGSARRRLRLAPARASRGSLIEQPDRARAALAALGEVLELQASGTGRFASVAERWRELVATGACGLEDDPSGSRPVAVGGFAFASDGGSAPHWAGFEPASLSVPEVALARGGGVAGGGTRMTLAALAGPDDLLEELLARIERRLAELREQPLPLLDPAPAARRFRLPARCRPSTTSRRSPAPSS